MSDLHLVNDLAIALSLALVGGLVAHALRLPVIAGYILAGVVMGPFTPGYRADPATIHELAEIGVVFLMFGVGIHFTPRDLRDLRRTALPAGIIQTVLVAAAIAVLASVAAMPLREAIVLGLALSMTSTVVLVRALEDRRIIHTERGRAIIGWLIVQDLLTIVVLLSLPTLAGGSIGIGQIALAVRALAYGAVVLVGGMSLLPRVLPAIAHRAPRELLLLVVVCLSLGIAAGAQRAGVSPALGAFIAGVVVGGTAVSHRAAQDVVPLRDAFAVLFFVSVGMLIDPGVVFAHPIPVFVGMLGLLVLKPIISLCCGVALRLPAGAALLAGAGMAQGGEFSFILADAGVALGLLQAEAYNAVLAASAIAITVNPLMLRGSDALQRRAAGSARLGRWLGVVPVSAGAFDGA